MYRSFLGGFVVCALIMLASCRGAQKMVYFKENTPPDSAVITQMIAQHSDATIQPDDIISISIASISFAPEDKPSQVFLDGGQSYNTGVASNGTNLGQTSAKNSYLVDSSGYIDYPRLGRLKVGGLSISQSKELLVSRLKDYLKQPVVEVRIVNYRVTMFGEVGTPGTLLAPNHKMNIIDALAASGGVLVTGQRDNVLIIREQNGSRVFAHLDLTSRNVFNSLYYYLRQNDIVYVPPTRLRRQEANEFLRFYLPTFASLFGTALSIFTLVQVSKK